MFLISILFVLIGYNGSGSTKLPVYVLKVVEVAAISNKNCI
tara:strand:- start:146 stop:268 length:123 start_codon:yes stop_codon:yes gene_type:complete